MKEGITNDISEKSACLRRHRRGCCGAHDQLRSDQHANACRANHDDHQDESGGQFRAQKIKEKEKREDGSCKTRQQPEVPRERGA
jgi:hypothetical protein